MRLSAILLLATGCDGLLHLTRVEPPGDGSGDAVARDGTGDGDAPHDVALDAYAGCQPLAAFSTNTQLTAANLISQSIAQNADFAIVIDNAGNLDFVQPIATGTASATTASSSTYTYAALAPTLATGSSLFVVDSGQASVVESKYLGPPANQWSAPADAMLPMGVGPGTPAEVNGGLRMMVLLGSSFTEYSRASGSSTWTALAGSTLAPIDLGHTSGSLSFPSLTPDGLNLTYVFTDTTSSGIYTSHRNSLADSFGTSRILRSGSYYSPVLAADCSAVYAVGGAGHLLYIH